MKKLFLLFIALTSFFHILADTQIQMEEYNGVYRIPCTLNGAKMKFIFDTGASNVCLSLSMAEYLYDNEYINADDIIGTGSSSLADGRIVDHVIINIRDIEIAGSHLSNVQAVVIGGQNAPLLIGQSAIQKLGAIELNGSLLTLHNDSNSDSQLIDRLFEEASTAYDNKLYDRAAAKFAQLHSMNQLSDYGKFLYIWALLMNNDPETALEISNEISNFNYFDERKIDIYRLLGYVHQDLNKYSNAIWYFEQSSKLYEGDGAQQQWLRNLKLMADCYYDMGDYSNASKHYQYAFALHGMMNNVDMEYIHKDGKNKLKKNQTSYRTDEIDYIHYQMYFCMERSGECSSEGFLFEATAMARAGNKYATKMLNKAGINPYADCWQ